MNKRHATVIAVLIGLAALLGTFATIRTAQLGAAARAANKARIAAQERRLAAAERSLRRGLAARPTSSATTKAARTVYVRPTPIVVHLHPHGDDGMEGGSFDD
jgi:hypothetical protein